MLIQARGKSWKQLIHHQSKLQRSHVEAHKVWCTQLTSRCSSEEMTSQVLRKHICREHVGSVYGWISVCVCVLVCVFNQCVCPLDRMFMWWNVCERAHTCIHSRVCAFQKVARAVNHTFLDTYRYNPRLNRNTLPHTHAITLSYHILLHPLL